MKKVETEYADQGRKDVSPHKIAGLGKGAFDRSVHEDRDAPKDPMIIIRSVREAL